MSGTCGGLHSQGREGVNAGSKKTVELRGFPDDMLQHATVDFLASGYNRYELNEFLRNFTAFVKMPNI